MGAQSTNTERFSAGLGVTLGLPQGDFRDHADVALGLNAYGLWYLAAPRGLAIRLDGLLLDYGGDRVPLAVGGTIGRASLESKTDHLIIAPLIGPQLGVRRGDFRPYVNAGLGPSFFVTTEEIKLRDSVYDDGESFGGSTVFDDVAVAWTLGGGLWGRISERIHFTVSAQYMANSRVSYLADGLVRRSTNGFVELEPVESRVDLLLLQVGVAGLVP